MSFQNVQDAAKAVLRDKFMVIQAYLKEEKSKINTNSTSKWMENKKEQTKLKIERTKETGSDQSRNKVQ